ncbi:MAG: hypothetical protein IH960_07830, partial [Chloroflexi bacterium]|nr:hypothetical protein [Chloroflexota bacterium]
PVFESAFANVRDTGKPFCQVVHTFRLGPHSKGDDPRTEDEIAPWRKLDPLVVGRRHFSESDVERVYAEVSDQVNELVERVTNHNTQRSAPGVPVVAPTDTELIPSEFGSSDGWLTGSESPRVVDHLRQALRSSLDDDPSVHLFGEDIVDPYGGAFKITRGLSTDYPDRVFQTPISEAAIVGIANGMALKHLRPIVEIMFGDFTTLVVDQVVNHMTKFGRMYGGDVSCPVIIRSPMGGYRGYGPTHSQTLEKLFLGVPGLVVVAMSTLHDQHLTWKRMCALGSPVFFVENKTLYGQRMKSVSNGRIGKFAVKSSRSYFPTLTLNVNGFDEPANVSIVTYGGMVDLALEAAERLFVEEELSVDVAVLSQIAPLPERDLQEVMARSDRFVTLEEGTKRAGWGAEVSASLIEMAGDKQIRITRHAADDTIIPNAKSGEISVLPSIDGLVDAIQRITR